MAWKFSILVVANVTADSDDLLQALRARAERGPIAITLLVPATGGGQEGRAKAGRKLAAGLERMHAAGLEADGSVGDPDPVVAVHEAWDPREWDEIVVSTLPTGTSKWLQVDLPHRIERITDLPVTHVVVHEPKPPVASSPAREQDSHGLLSPLRVLTWGTEKAPEPSGEER